MDSAETAYWDMSYAVFGLENRKKITKFTCHSHASLFFAYDPLLYPKGVAIRKTRLFPPL
jgi:hypothetical protein